MTLLAGRRDDTEQMIRGCQAWGVGSRKRQVCVCGKGVVGQAGKGREESAVSQLSFSMSHPPPKTKTQVFFSFSCHSGQIHNRDPLPSAPGVSARLPARQKVPATV